MIVYLPDRQAEIIGFYLNLLTCPVENIQHFQQKVTQNYHLTVSGHLRAATHAILSPPLVNGSIDYTPLTINCGVRTIVTSPVLPCASDK